MYFPKEYCLLRQRNVNTSSVSCSESHCMLVVSGDLRCHRQKQFQMWDRCDLCQALSIPRQRSWWLTSSSSSGSQSLKHKSILLITVWTMSKWDIVAWSVIKRYSLAALLSYSLSGRKKENASFKCVLLAWFAAQFSVIPLGVLFVYLV